MAEAFHTRSRATVEGDLVLALQHGNLLLHFGVQYLSVRLWRRPYVLLGDGGHEGSSGHGCQPGSWVSARDDVPLGELPWHIRHLEAWLRWRLADMLINNSEGRWGVPRVSVLIHSVSIQSRPLSGFGSILGRLC